VNGVYASQHHTLLTQILKEEWGFEGLVVSDWGAVHDRVAALRAGLDLEMPGPRDRRVQAVVDAVRCGELAEATLDESVRRILRIVFRARQTPKGGALDVEAHHALARTIAAEGMVLLKNDPLLPQGRLLPLQGHRQIAVIGRSAQVAHFQGGGSSQINPIRVDVPFQELQARAGSAELTYAEGYPADGSFRQDLIDEAVGVAQAADVALLYIALPKESEGHDRADLDLTAQQVALIQAVAQAQPKTVVVLNNGAAVAMSAWIDAVPAVLEGWLMGQAGGGALADLLFGRANPCGKLAETFPLKLSDTPAYLNWPGGAGKVRYGEGLFIGYRYYDARELPVLFPFGHGLSYTTFAYSQARVSAQTFRDVDGLTVTVDVTNTGPVAGKEIVQVYVHDRAAGLVRPEKELKGFAKVALQPGETRPVAVKLDFRAFAYYHPQYKQWITEDGEFDILIGSSSADIRHTLAVRLESTLDLPCLLDRESTIRQWMADPRGNRVFAPIYGLMVEGFRSLSGGGEGGESATGLDLLAMIGDMPLLNVLMWQEGALPLDPEDLVDGLLAQVHGQAG
jgi:beta-glucosidase